MWGATIDRKLRSSAQEFQSTLPVWGATARSANVERTCDFNPRSPCGERPSFPSPASLSIRFQSTLPVWGATQVRGQRVRASGYFNPRSPCGERPLAAELLAKEGIFQSTLPVWGATVAPGAFSDTLGISIHAPRVGSDERGECMPSPENIISIHAPRVGSDWLPGSLG